MNGRGIIADGRDIQRGENDQVKLSTLYSQPQSKIFMRNANEKIQLN